MVDIYSSEISAIIDQTLVIILAGGKGARLSGLTEEKAKPCVEFGAGYRLIDFPLSNCINSGLKRIGVVTQYKAQSLLGHLLNQSKKFNTQNGEYIELLPASQQRSERWYSGTADAIYQNIAFIKNSRAKYVMILSGDHIYKMDYRNILEEHVKSTADTTISCIETPIKNAIGQLGIVSVDNKNRVMDFKEKPLFPSPLAHKPNYTLASMGNYVFNTDCLLRCLHQDANNVLSSHDFGKNVIPRLIQHSKVYSFIFQDKDKNTPYWKDVGTLDNYFLANMDLLDPSLEISMFKSEWAIYGDTNNMRPTRFLSNSQHKQSTSVCSSLIGNGCTLHPSAIEHSIIFENVEIHSGVIISRSLVLSGSVIHKNCHLHKTIVEAGCIVPANTFIGINKKDDIRRGFTITEKGVTLVTQKALMQCNANKTKLKSVYYHFEQNSDKEPSKSFVPPLRKIQAYLNLVKSDN